MAFTIPTITYTGKVKEISLGPPERVVKVGNAGCYPFHLFEGEMGNPPRIAMEVYDVTPEDWPPAAREPFADVLSDPVAWAKKCVDVYGAEMVCLQLVSTDPNGLNRPAGEAAATARRVADALTVPLLVWGSGDVEKDAEVLRQVCEACEGKHLVVGPVQDKNYKKIGAPAIGYRHTVIASTPIDVNLAKQLNILLGNLGVPDELLVMDPTVGGLGYGLEYTYSVMERMRMAALTQQDDRLQFPLVCNLAKEVWKVKEVRLDDPKLGDPGKRGILMEAITAVLLALAGADVLIMRHPEAVRLVRGYLAEMMGAAA